VFTAILVELGALVRILVALVLLVLLARALIVGGQGQAAAPAVPHRPAVTAPPTPERG
jgi:hypothetical protein